MSLYGLGIAWKSAVPRTPQEKLLLLIIGQLQDEEDICRADHWTLARFALMQPADVRAAIERLKAGDALAELEGGFTVIQ